MTSADVVNQIDSVWASEITKVLAARAGGDFLEQMARAKIIFTELEIAIRSSKLNVYAPGVSGMVERPIRQQEPTFPVGDYRLRRGTVEDWWVRASTTVPVDRPINQDTKAGDPKRRLNRLRELGGDVIFSRKKNGWVVTGITKLVNEEETRLGRRRYSEQTIRGDLKEAAEAERADKTAGHFDGLVGR